MASVVSMIIPVAWSSTHIKCYNYLANGVQRKFIFMIIPLEITMPNAKRTLGALNYPYFLDATGWTIQIESPQALDVCFEQ